MLWFTQVVFRWRTFGSCVWLWLIVCPTLCVFNLAVDLLAWKTLHVLPSVWDLLLISLYLTILTLVMLLYSTTYTMKLPVFKNRLAYIRIILRPQQLVVIATFMLLGGASAYCLSHLVGYGGLREPCSRNGDAMCVNEYSVFIVAYGSVMGIVYGVIYYLDKSNFITFPAIQQKLTFRVRGHIFGYFKDGLTSTWKILRVYYLVYYFTGCWLHHVVGVFLSAHSSSTSSLASVKGLLDLPLFLCVVSISVMVHFTWSVGLHLFQAYHTQVVRFPIVATFSGDSSRLLSDALKSNIHLLKALAFLDLYQLSLHSPQRRKEVFSLSVGEQPEVWSDVCDQCLRHIRDITSRLSNKDGLPSNSAPVTSSNSATNDSSNQPFASNSPSQSSPVSKGWTSPSVQTYLSSPGVTRRFFQSEGARLWSTCSPGQSREAVSTPPPPSKPTPSSFSNFSIKIRNLLLSIPINIAANLRKKPFFIYFLDELPGCSEQDVCGDSQLTVWVITSISELAIASYSEDTYGVVQRSLPAILECLLDLSQVMEKLLKAPLSNSESTGNACKALEANGRYAIKMAVQTALSRLAVTYTNDRRNIALSHPYCTYWDKFFPEL